MRGWLTGDPVSIWDGLFCLVAAVGTAVLTFYALRKK